MRMSAPISGGPISDSPPRGPGKRFDHLGVVMCCQNPLPSRTGRAPMSTSTREEIRIGPLAISPLVEGDESGGTVALHECDVPAGAGLPVAHSHDAYEETIYGLEGTITF